MGELEVYTAIRSEIVINHVLLHLSTLVVVLVLLGGIWLLEKRRSVLSVFLPLLSLAWTAAIVRFDFFIHRQAAYLRAMEATLQGRGSDVPYWELWKGNLRSTAYVLPIVDALAMLVIVVPTVYLLFGPCKAVFTERQWRGHLLYAWAIVVIIFLLLGTLPFIPRIATV